MSVFILRHGETDWNTIDRLQGHTNIPLNMSGKKRIEKVAYFFKRDIGDIGYIISSPLSRAYESAIIFSNCISYKKEIIIDNLFIERCFGLAEGMLHETIKSRYPDFDIPEMETEQNVFNRAFQGLNYYYSKYPDVNILIVTHGAVLKTIVDNRLTYGEVGVNNIKPIPGGLFKVDMSEEGYRIEEIQIS